MSARVHGERPKSPSQWAPVETVLQRPSCTRRLAKGRNGQLGRGCWVHARDNRERLGAVGIQAGGSGQAKRNKMSAGCD